MTRPDFTEKNATVARGLPLASACLLISVTFNTVLSLLVTHFFSPSELVNAMFVWLPIFHALTQNKLSNPTKSLHCLPLCELMSITSRKKGGKKRGRETKREEDWSEGEESETCLWVSFCLREEKLSGWQSPWPHYLSMSAWWIRNFPWLLSSSATHAYKITKTRVQAVSCVLPMVFETPMVTNFFAVLHMKLPARIAQYLMWCHETQSENRFYNQK